MRIAVLSLVQMSIRAGALIIITAIVRKGLLYRLPKGVFLTLWMAAVIRLLLPFSVSVPMALPMPVLPAAGLPAPPAHAQADVAVRSVPGTEGGAFFSLSVLWGLGAGLAMLYFCTVYLRARLKFSRSTASQDPEIDLWLSRRPLCRRIQVRTAHIASPVTYGVLRPVILLPAEGEYADKLHYILLHEYTHIKYFHSVMKLLLAVCLCLHWFNPAVWVLYFLANGDMELFCDEKVLREYGGEVKTDYALALVHMWNGKAVDPNLHNHFSQSAVKERIVAIMKYKKCSAVSVLLALVLAMGITCAAFAAAPDGAGVTVEEGEPVPSNNGRVINGPVIVEDGEPVPSNNGFVIVEDRPIPKKNRSPELTEDGAPIDRDKLSPWPTDSIAPYGELCFGIYMMQFGTETNINGTCPDGVTMYVGIKNIGTGQTITQKVTGGDYWTTVTIPEDGNYCLYVRNASPEEAEVEISYAMIGCSIITEPSRTKVFYLK